LIESDGKTAFQTEIRQVFSNPIKAIEWEKKVLRRMKVIGNSDFLNRSIACSAMFEHSEETKQKMRKPKPPRTKEHSKNLSKAKKGINPHNGKIHPRSGQKKTKSELKKISETMLAQKRKWMNNGKDRIFVCSDQVDNYLKIGYTLGRGISYRKLYKEKQH